MNKKLPCGEFECFRIEERSTERHQTVLVLSEGREVLAHVDVTDDERCSAAKRGTLQALYRWKHLALRLETKDALRNRLEYGATREMLQSAKNQMIGEETMQLELLEESFEPLASSACDETANLTK